MKILFIAPQPFFQDRGTPIAVKLAVEVIGRNYSVDLLTYNEGCDIELPIDNHFRINKSSLTEGIRPGFSIKKCFADIQLFFKVINLIKTNKYDLIHCVEESVFIGLFIKIFHKIPYVYDLDSALSNQIVEKFNFLRILKPIFNFFEKKAIKNAICCIAVCKSLVDYANNFGSKKTYLLTDISLLENNQEKSDIDFRKEYNISSDKLIGLYIGNLEKYQGVELLVESFNLVTNPNLILIIIGGTSDDISKIKKLISKEKENLILFLGYKPVVNLKSFLEQADILFSPRITGNNTPMKIYSYLHAGKALVATNLATHTQVLNSNIAFLVEPNTISMSYGITQLIENIEMRNNLAKNAKKHAEDNYTFKVFEQRLNKIYSELEKELS